MFFGAAAARGWRIRVLEIAGALKSYKLMAMTDDKELVQKMFDEVTGRTGIPRIDLSEADSAALPFGEGMLLHVQYRKAIPEVVFTVPLGTVPQEKRAQVFERLLEANFYWIGTRGATLSYHADIEQVVLQYQEVVTHLTPDRLQSVLEGFLAVAIEWKETLAKLLEEAGEEAFPPPADSALMENSGAGMFIQP